jgi:hypothetical protein
VDFKVSRPAETKIELEAAFHSARRLPRQLQVKLPWSAAELKTGKGGLEKAAIFIPRSEFEGQQVPGPSKSWG